MKTIKKLSAVVVLAMMTIFSSCSNSSDGGGGGTAALGTLKANIGGANFTSIAQGTTAVDAFNGTYHNFSISGVDASGKSIILMILATEITAGTYQLEETNDMLYASCAYTEVDLSNPTASQSWGAPYDGGGNSGSITITSKTDTNVKGTFSLTAGNPETGTTKSITNGSFNINITN